MQVRNISERERVRHAVAHFLQSLRKKEPDMPFTAIAKKVGCTPGIVQRVAKKLQANLPVCDAPRPGRSKVLSTREQAKLKRLACGRSVRSIERDSLSIFGKQVSNTTMQRYLHQSGVKRGVAKKASPQSRKRK